jgi:hypothetical protein
MRSVNWPVPPSSSTSSSSVVVSKAATPSTFQPFNYYDASTALQAQAAAAVAAANAPREGGGRRGGGRGPADVYNPHAMSASPVTGATLSGVAPGAPAAVAAAASSIVPPAAYGSRAPTDGLRQGGNRSATYTKFK